MVNLVAVIVILSAVCLSAYPNTQLTEKRLTGIPSTRLIIVKRLKNLWNLVGKATNSESAFVGRCFGIAKKLRFVIPLIIFLLGVIVTTLKFLTIFSLKGLGILILLLILNIGPIFTKFALLKFNQKESSPHYAAPIVQPQTVHFHVHNDKLGHYKIAHSSPGYEPEWSDRISEGLSKTTTLAEKTELLNLYKRLGFNTDSLKLPERSGIFLSLILAVGVHSLNSWQLYEGRGQSQGLARRHRVCIHKETSASR